MFYTNWVPCIRHDSVWLHSLAFIGYTFAKYCLSHCLFYKQFRLTIIQHFIVCSFNFVYYLFIILRETYSNTLNIRYKNSNQSHYQTCTDRFFYIWLNINKMSIIYSINIELIYLVNVVLLGITMQNV